MATFVNDLRLKEIATGDESGTWGTSTNTNLELIGEAMGLGAETIPNASTHTITMADGTSDEFRSLFLRLTGGGTACTVTLAPNTLSHTWIMRNETSAALTLTQGSGANVTIAAGQTKIVATDGGGSGAIVYEMDDLELAGNLTAGGGTIVSTGSNAFSSKAVGGYAIQAYQDATSSDHTALDLRSDATASTRYLIRGYNDAAGTPTEVFSVGADGSAFLNSNLGIGTSSAETNLHIEDSSSFSIIRLVASTTEVAGIDFGDPDDRDIGRVRYNNSDNSMVFHTNAAEAMRIDSSGNVGIGTSNATPSNGEGMCLGSGSTITRLDIRNSTTGDATGDGTSLQLNGNNFTIENREAGYVAFATSLTERMRIDSSGLVGLGTTNPQSVASGYGALTVGGTTGGGINFNSTGSAFGQIYGNNTNVVMSAFSSRFIAFNTNSLERMRIDSSGNVGIGESNPTEKLSLAKGISYNADSALFITIGVNDSAVNNNAPYRWRTGITGNATGHSYTFSTIGRTESVYTERARIDSSGNLLIGSSSSSATSGEGSKFVSNGRLFQVSSYSTSAQESLAMYSTGVSAYRFYVDWGGTVHATSTSISAISDQRLKENIRDLDAGLDEVLALKPRKFDWKEGKGANTKDARGFIAQEFEEVFPDLIDEWKDPAPEGEEPYKSVRQDLIPVLVKAIQEQQAQIEALQSEINLLKGE